MAVLMDDLVEECLLRLPPEDPASLVRAALVCKRWHHLISGRRFRELHRTPPLLGFVGTLAGGTHRPFMPHFVPTSSFRPPPRAAELGDWVAIHSCHGRVLLYKSRRELPELSWYPIPTFSWNAAVVCNTSSADAGAGCDHLHCIRVSFVIFVATLYNETTVTSVYSSDADAWSDQTSTQVRLISQFYLATGAIAGNAIYFNNSASTELIKYDLTTRDVSAINLPDQAFLKDIALMAMENSRLGCATLYGSMLHMWSTEVGPNNRDVRWEQSRVIELDTLLPADALSSKTCLLAGCADGGEVILLWTASCFLCVDLKSRRIKEVEGGSRLSNFAVPVTSFCTLQHWESACTDEGSGGEPFE
ncbi:unnamed protein product [Urochloa decumbens]|uniref:F-box domain-containing protein n=1 Tax=Urochloa decumbens TaxID=240449 RepID=A0ABC9FLH7_9POAL